MTPLNNKQLKGGRVRRAVVQIADSAGTVVRAFVATKATASLVFSSAAITAGEEYTVYTGGTATVSAGLGEGSLDGAREVGTVTRASTPRPRAQAVAAAKRSLTFRTIS